MNVFYLSRTVSGLFDVPLDDPKQRFSQKMRMKNSEIPTKGPKSAFRASSVPRRFQGASRWSTAACAHHEPCTARQFARTRTHARPCAPPRLALALRRRLPPIPRRDIRSDFVSEPHRRLGGAESWLELLGWSLVLLGQDADPRQVWSHRGPGPSPISDTPKLRSCAPSPPCHLTLPSTKDCHGPEIGQKKAVEVVFAL